MKRSSIAACLSATVLAMTVAACGSLSQARGVAAPKNCKPTYDVSTLNKGVLKVAGPDYPPLFTYENGKVGGVDGAFLKWFADKACLGIDVQVLPASGVIESVRGQRADVAAGGWYVTGDRAKVVGQTNPFYADPPVLVAKKPSASLNDYAKSTIGTTQGYLWVSDLQKFAGDRARLYQSPDAVFADVSNGRVNVGLMAVAEASFRLGNHPGSGLSYKIAQPNPAIRATEQPPVTNIPYVKGNQKMGEALNKAMADFRNSGQLAAALKAAGIDPSAANPKVS